jgi:hypothetical protein
MIGVGGLLVTTGGIASVRGSVSEGVVRQRGNACVLVARNLNINFARPRGCICLFELRVAVGDVFTLRPVFAWSRGMPRSGAMIE